MIARWKDGRVTVLDEQAGRFLVLQQPLETALEQLQEHGMSAGAARAVLNVKVTDSAWRAAFVHCSGCTLVAVVESLKDVPESTDLDDIRETQATLSEVLAAVQEDVAADRRRQEMADLEAALTARAEQMIAVSGAFGVRGTLLENKVWEMLFATPEGVRLLEMRGAL